VIDRDTNNVDIVPIDVECQKFVTSPDDLDGNATNDNVVLPVDGNGHLVSYYVRICNTGDLPLLVSASDPLLALCPMPTDLPLAPHTCTELIFICSVNLTCGVPPLAEQKFMNTITVVGRVDLSRTNVCVWTTNGVEIRATSECDAMVSCLAQPICRVTGGGRQDNTRGTPSIVCPDEGVRYVTHGGQVGAPVGERTCSIDTSLPGWRLGNPCIHGRWTHVRHMKGGLRGNFHARFYDTLDCFCLDDTFQDGCHYDAGTTAEGKKHSLCNAGDRSLGPEPRKAPANKIAFTGVGDWQCDSGRRAPRACLFRVDIEDRGEPGNAHAQDSNGKPNRIPDRYRIRIWVLTEAEQAALDSGDGLLAFRNCISACNGIDYLDGGIAGPGGDCDENDCSGDRCTGEGGVGTITFPGGCPVRKPTIDDGGELLHGNHQIHPAIKDCDPANPTGPGLAKP